MNPFAPVKETTWNDNGIKIEEKYIEKDGRGILTKWDGNVKVMRYCIFSPSSQMNWTNVSLLQYEKLYYDNLQLKSILNNLPNADTNYVSYFQNNNWTAPTPLPFNSDSFSCGHPGFSADGKTLFFSSDMPGGFGEKDIWKINYDPVKNNWGEAQNMGNQINSFEDELFPFVDENGDLFFSSKGHTGMGGLDIFKSSLVNGNYSKAENLKYPINSGGDDFGLNYISQKNREKDGMIAYFASNRDGGVGDDDLYGISIKPFVFLVKGKVLEREGLSPISVASVKLKNQTGPTIFEIKKYLILRSEKI
jgi:hypothetical protein